MNQRRYAVIQGWMLDLDLDLTETVIYAVIFGFSQAGDSTFKMSQSYLATMAKCSRRKVCQVLPKLVEKGLIEKIDINVRGIRLCEYRATEGCAQGAQGVQNMHGGCAQGAHNNKYINNISKDISLSNKRDSKFQKPSVEEVAAYCRERGNWIDAESFVSFYESKGWLIGKSPMKNWKAAVRTWEKRSEQTPNPQPPSPRRNTQPQRRESTFEHNLKAADRMFGTNLHESIYGGGQQNE